MTLGPQHGHARIATLERVRPDLLEISYKPGAIFSRDDVTEVQDMRRALMGQRHYATLTIIPEDTDFTLDSMRSDHAAPDRTSGQVVASAIVTHSSMIERLTHVYFKFFPHLQRLLVTDNEQEARTWLHSQLEELSNTGS